jgi:hypothetical protein
MSWFTADTAAVAKRLFVVCTLAVIVNAGEAQAECTPTFRKISEDGLGDAGNSVIWALRQFKGKLYAGTSNRVTGVEIHEWDPDTEIWTRVVEGGLGNLNNTGVRHMEVFQGFLYAGTVNGEDGAELWRSEDGQNWEVVVTGAFGNPTAESIRSIASFRNFLYVGVMDGGSEGFGPGMLYRSLDGVNFEPVITDGFGDVDNDSFHRFAKLKGFFYSLMRHTRDGPPEIWRTADGDNWRQVVGPDSDTPAGFGIPGTQLFYSARAFKGRLYVGTGNYFGFSLHRTPDGLDWQTLGVFGFGTPGDGSQFTSNPGNLFAWRFEVFEDSLWLGIFNYTGARLWKTDNGVNWIEVVGPEGIAPPGFGEEANYGIRSLEEMNDRLYLGTAQCILEFCTGAIPGAAVWEYSGEACETP